jgi:hypothetical protein
MAKRGHLTLVSTLLEERQDKPGAGNLSVKLTRRNKRELHFYDLPREFRRCYRAYNRNFPLLSNFADRRNVTFTSIVKGTFIPTQEHDKMMLQHPNIPLRSRCKNQWTSPPYDEG